MVAKSCDPHNGGTHTGARHSKLSLTKVSALTIFVAKESEYIDLGKPKSVASVIYLDVENNYTVIQHVKQILDDFVVSAVSSQNCARKCAKSQVLFLPTASRSFLRP